MGEYLFSHISLDVTLCIAGLEIILPHTLESHVG